MYENEDLSLKMFSVSAGIRILSVVFAFCTWMFYDVTLCNRGKVTEENEMKNIGNKYNYIGSRLAGEENDL